MDLSSLSLADLIALQQKIPAEIKKRQEQEKSQVLNELKKLAEARGFSLDQLIKGGEKTRAKGAKAAFKYRHPELPDVGWTGRGRKPQWVQDWLAAGRNLNDLAI